MVTSSYYIESGHIKNATLPISFCRIKSFSQALITGQIHKMKNSSALTMLILVLVIRKR